MSTTSKQELIHLIIDKATSASVASAGIWGHSIQYKQKPTSELDRKKFDQFIDLFSTLKSEERMDKMKRTFPSKTAKDNIDIGFFRGWLKDVAEIMDWLDGSEVRDLLGLSKVDTKALAKTEVLDKDHQKANEMLDNLDKVFKPSVSKDIDRI